jgi:hypothetical protein
MLSPGKRPGTQALRRMGTGQATHCPPSHRVLNRAVGSRRAAGQRLRGVWRSAFAPCGTLVLGLDDTLERRRGATMAATGLSREPGRSSQAPVVKASGWRWRAWRVVGPLPGAARGWARPGLTCVGPSQRDDAPRGRTHRTVTDRARPRWLLVARWRPGRAVMGPTDSRCAALALREAVHTQGAVGPPLARGGGVGCASPSTEAHADRPAPHARSPAAYPAPGGKRQGDALAARHGARLVWSTRAPCGARQRHVRVGAHRHTGGAAALGAEPRPARHVGHARVALHAVGGAPGASPGMGWAARARGSDL